MDFHKGRWRLALGRLVNLRYINRWIIFSADLFVSLSVSLLGVLGMFSILHIRIGEPDVLKVGLSSFVASIVSFLLFKAYHGVIRHSTLRGLWRIGGAAIGKSLLMFLLLWLLKARFSPSIYWLGGIMDSTLTIVMLVSAGLSPEKRVPAIVMLAALFAIGNFYMIFRAIHDIGREDVRPEIIEIPPIEIPDVVPADTLPDKRVQEMEEFFNRFNQKENE